MTTAHPSSAPTGDASPPTRRAWAFGLKAAGLLALVFAVYSNTFAVPFVLDDFVNIANNRHIRVLWPVAAPPMSSLSGRPVGAWSFALNYAAHGYALWGYHLVNILIHGLAALALLGVVRRALIDPKAEALREFAPAAENLAWGAALLWAAHPILTQCVTYLTQRLESLMGLCFFLTMYCALRGWSSKRPVLWRCAAGLVFFLGVGVKENIAAAPFLVLAFDVLVRRSGVLAALRGAKTLYGLYAAGLCLLALQIFSGAQWSAGGRYTMFTHGEYLLTQSKALMVYLKLVLWPTGLVFDYWQLPLTEGQAAPYLAGVGVLLGLTGWAVWKRPAVGFLGLWWFAALAPTSLSPLPDAIVEYRVYVSLAALSTLVVLGGYALLRRWGLQQFGAVALAALVAALGWATWARNGVYGSEISLWRDTAAKRPMNPRAWYNLSETYSRLGNAEQELAMLQASLKADPDFTLALNNLGAVLLSRGYAEQALQYFLRTLEINNYNLQAHMNAGVVLAGQGRLAEAQGHFTNAGKLAQDPAEKLYIQGVYHFVTGDKGAAAQALEGALRINPRHAPARELLARTR